MSSSRDASPKKYVSGHKNTAEDLLECSSDISEITVIENKPSCSSLSVSGTERGMTPLRNYTSLKSFKKGVLCSSTPVPPLKKAKLECENLCTIEEVDSSCEGNEVTVIENKTIVVPDVEENNNIAVVENKITNVKEQFLSLKKSIIAIGTDETSLKPDDKEELLKSQPQVNMINASPNQENDLNDTLNDSVLRKDELSMIIDMPHNKMDTIHEKISILPNSEEDKNNLTLHVDKDLSVTYRNLKEKVIDEVNLVNADLDIIGFINVNEPDRDEILKKASNLKVFVSNNEEENKDNHDPEWEALKKLETDDERYKAVRKIWMNLNIPNPKENLSVFNWRKKNSLGPLKNIKVPESLSSHSESEPHHHCTDIFDRGISNLINFVNRRKMGLDVEHRYEYSILDSLNNPTNGMNIDKLLKCIRERLHRHEQAKEEIEAVNKFYNGLRNREANASDLLYLSPREYQEVLDVETMISCYSHWYRK